MMIFTPVLTTLVTGLALGLVIGLVILCVDRRRKKSKKTLYIKDGITLEYDCSMPGIYERIRALIDDK